MAAEFASRSSVGTTSVSTGFNTLQNLGNQDFVSAIDAARNPVGLTLAALETEATSWLALAGKHSEAVVVTGWVDSLPHGCA